MVHYTTTIHHFEEKGEKTGWTYIEIPANIAAQLKPGNKKSFRVKGQFDAWNFTGLAALPMGGGTFIIALNATTRKAIHKGKGAQLHVRLQEDTVQKQLPEELVSCLTDEPAAQTAFNKLPKSHQHYWANWIMSAKTQPTRAKRIVQTITAMLKGIDFGTLQRTLTQERKELGK